MSDKLRIELDDNTSPGLQKMEGNLGEVAQAANKTEKQLNEAGAASKKLGDTGSKSAVDWSSKITALNQGLELLKKGAEITFATITALAEDGSPAFVELQDSIDGVRQALLKTFDDPTIQQGAEDLAAIIKNDVTPSIGGLTEAATQSYRGLGLLTTLISEKLGLVEKGATVARLATEGLNIVNREARKQEIAAKREQIVVDDKLAEIDAKLAEESELRNIAQSTSIRGLTDLIELETEALRDQERAQTGTAKSREAAYKRIELAQRRIREVEKSEADNAIKEAERVAQAKIDEQARFDEAVKAGQAEQDRLRQEQLDKATEEANAAADRLLKAIDMAKGVGGGNLIDETRQGISAEATRAAVVRQAQEEARQKFISENRDKVDLEGRAVGNTTAERQANQRRADRQIELAQRQAGIQAFRDFNAGRTSQEDIVGAQNTLMQSALQAAQSRGQVDAGYVRAFAQITNQQQQQAAINQRATAEMQRINNVLSSLNASLSQNTLSRSRFLVR